MSLCQGLDRKLILLLEIGQLWLQYLLLDIIVQHCCSVGKSYHSHCKSL